MNDDGNRAVVYHSSHESLDLGCYEYGIHVIRYCDPILKLMSHFFTPTCTKNGEWGDGRHVWCDVV